MEAFAALPGGALLVLVSGIVENKYIKYMRTRYISYMNLSHNGNLTENSGSGSCIFVEAEVVFYTTLLHEWACIGGTKFTSAHDIVYHGHNGLHVHNNGANIAIPLGSKTESLHSTSERGTLCGNLVSLAHQWPGCQKVQG